MHFKIIQPNGLLRNYVKQYCFMESDKLDGIITERVIPTEAVQIMFHYKEPFVVNRPDNKSEQQPRSLLSGLSNSYSDVSTHGESGVIFVQFLPEGACHFFNFPLNTIENLSVNLSDIFCSDINHIEELLYYEKSYPGKIKIVEDFLIRHFCPISNDDLRIIQTSIQIIRQKKGQISASVLANKLPVTPKSLERKFSIYLGKTPKQFIKLIRYQEILANFNRYRDIQLTDHAYLNGYFDQSHFIRDFKMFTGFTPKEFISRYPDCDINADC